ncbi:hypothetical protein ACFXA3_19300 [Streptomyces sp. NPDC059456]|uniref:hypothetical protein n=1 Tax=Streptomyces sp. NPDC059456 TaxID=3346838 RepID=UPI003681A258
MLPALRERDRHGLRCGRARNAPADVVGVRPATEDGMHPPLRWPSGQIEDVFHALPSLPLIEANVVPLALPRPGQL